MSFAPGLLDQPRYHAAEHLAGVDGTVAVHGSASGAGHVSPREACARQSASRPLGSSPAGAGLIFCARSASLVASQLCRAASHRVPLFVLACCSLGKRSSPIRIIGQEMYGGGPIHPPVKRKPSAHAQSAAPSPTKRTPSAHARPAAHAQAAAIPQ